MPEFTIQVWRYTPTTTYTYVVTSTEIVFYGMVRNDWFHPSLFSLFASSMSCHAGVIIIFLSSIMVCALLYCAVLSCIVVSRSLLLHHHTHTIINSTVATHPNGEHWFHFIFWNHTLPLFLACFLLFWWKIIVDDAFSLSYGSSRASPLDLCRVGGIEKGVSAVSSVTLTLTITITMTPHDDRCGRYFRIDSSAAITVSCLLLLHRWYWW